MKVPTASLGASKPNALYSAVDKEFQEIVAQACYEYSMKVPTWEDLVADRSLRNLPYKIETNRHHKIILSPSSHWHSDYQTQIAVTLLRLMPKGRAPVECAIQTAEGVRVADVTWISMERREPYRRSMVLPIAPEICVEILSPSNTRQEMMDKMMLYYAEGAEEVWLCDEKGCMEFFTRNSTPEPVPASLRCPEFPLQIDIG